MNLPVPQGPKPVGVKNGIVIYRNLLQASESAAGPRPSTATSGAALGAPVLQEAPMANPKSSTVTSGAAVGAPVLQEAPMANPRPSTATSGAALHAPVLQDALIAGTRSSTATSAAALGAPMIQDALIAGPRPATANSETALGPPVLQGAPMAGPRPLTATSGAALGAQVLQEAPMASPRPLTAMSAPMLQMALVASEEDEDGDYPLHIAVAQGEIDLIVQLLEAMEAIQMSVDITDANKQTPLHIAVIDNQPGIVFLLLNHGAKSHLQDIRGNSAIHLAVRNGSLEALTVLIQHGGPRDDLNLKNSDGFTPLHLAVLKGSPEMAELLLNAGVDVNTRDGKSGRTSLHHACESNNQRIVDLLLKHKADPNICNYDGDTPTLITCGMPNMEVDGLLVQYGADMSQKNMQPDTSGVNKGLAGPRKKAVASSNDMDSTGSNETRETCTKRPVRIENEKNTEEIKVRNPPVPLETDNPSSATGTENTID